MKIRVQQGKGAKHRYILLVRRTLDILRKYWREYRIVQVVLERAIDQAEIKKPATIHTLRHGFATHLLEAATGLCHIQHLLRYTTPETTTIYLHLSPKDLVSVISPIDC